MLSSLKIRSPIASAVSIVYKPSIFRFLRPSAARLSSSIPPPSLDVDTSLPSSSRSSEPGEELAHIIRQTIDATGPMPLARYMTLALSHATLGYYTRGDVFGRQGDFITSPEISQIFGELIAIYFITRWQANGSPSKVRLLELGPGRGTLMADVLRTFKSFPSIFSTIATIDLVDTSPVMKELQRVALDKVGLPDSVEVRWFDWVEEVPKDPATFTLFLAHEFFDALPIHLLQRDASPSPSPTSTTPSSYSSPTPSPSSSQAKAPSPPKPSFSELLLTYTPPSPSLHLTLSPDPTPASVFLPFTSPHLTSVQEGERVEICPSAAGIMKVLGELLAVEGGVGGSGLVVDYGRWGWTGNSFRAFKSHHPHPPFIAPGTADLTANVDFAYLTSLLPKVASPSSSALRVLGPTTQASFLSSMGLAPRVQRLMEAPDLDAKGREEIWEGARRLVAGRKAGAEGEGEEGEGEREEGMGEQYLVMGVECGKGTGEGEVYPFVESETK